MSNFSRCKSFGPIESAGNLINSSTVWNITGTLIHKISISQDEIGCSFGRNVLVPIRYRTIEDATEVCTALGEKGNALAQFQSLSDYETFYHSYLANPAIQNYCGHGGRYILWLPYQGWKDVTDDQVNVTYYKSTQPLQEIGAWKANNPKRNERPFCVVARLSNCFRIDLNTY